MMIGVGDEYQVTTRQKGIRAPGLHSVAPFPAACFSRRLFFLLFVDFNQIKY